MLLSAHESLWPWSVPKDEETPMRQVVLQSGGGEGKQQGSLNNNCSADGIYQPPRFGTRLITWQEIILKASYGTLEWNNAFLQVPDKLPLLSFNSLTKTVIF